MKPASVSVIFGTRPEAIKLAPVVLALQKDGRFRCQVCVTAQHREMLDQVLEVFGLVPDSDLDLMRDNQSPAGLTARAIDVLDGYLSEIKPDIVLVQGDTTTAFCAALAAFYHHIPVAHLEAGLRTGDPQSPWPEEVNRVLLSRLAALHFAPTADARDNLLREGVAPDRIVVTGNTGIDALFLAMAEIEKEPPTISGLPDFLQPSAHKDRLGIVLVTGHRRENFGRGGEDICRAIAELAIDLPDFHFVYPVHLNPNVIEPVQRILSGDGGEGRKTGKLLNNVHLTGPLPYLSFVALMEETRIILTDSGGVQEEAPYLGKPVLVLRDSTERSEAVASGNARLVGTSRAEIVAAVKSLLGDEKEYQIMANRSRPFGDGRSADRVISALAAILPGIHDWQGGFS